MVAAVALFAVVTSGSGDGGTDSSSTPAPTATSTPAKKDKAAEEEKATKTYTIKPGDSPSTIAESQGVDLDDLLAANPDADPGALTPGDKLKIP